MNFSTGQIAFIIFFIVAFAVGMIYAYRKDLQTHKKHYRGAGKTVAAVMITGVVVYVAVRFLIYRY